MLVRNYRGNIIDGIVKKVPCSSPLAGEARAVLEAYKLAVNMGVSSAIMESDSSIVISAIDLPIQEVDWTIQALILTIRALTSSISKVSLSKVKRRANRVADYLAKLYMQDKLPCNG
ncbi:hypothetical protein P3X46_012447 [Hevea brasiliensis]|uniref:RNase H type-1 domain-containing protein n=1 Tax=Hevea brasiliensis TaxID=3981 RepID=A0ABQ9MC51_HEVBR|nr:hypothetical protein P3X46_012447 [Hevea brasiliensis]